MMKYIAITYNYLTLCKSVIYAKKVWGLNDSRIFYLPTVSDTLCFESLSALNIVRVEYRARSSHCPLFVSKACEEIEQANAIVFSIDKFVKNNDDELSFVVFKDQKIRECVVINSLKKKYKNARIILIEEGLGLYSIPPKKNFSVKRVVRSLFMLVYGVPKYCIDNHSMGCNPAVNKIICKKPNALKKRGFSKNAELEEEYEIFDRDNCEYLLNKLFRINMNCHSFNYVFLSQPIYPNSRLSNEKYDEFLSNLFSVLARSGSVLIKKHPRDRWNYDHYKNNNVEICDSNINHIPFECIMGLYGNPQMLTLFSSAACNPLSNKKSIFLYKMLPESMDGTFIDELLIKDLNSIICNSFSELLDLLKERKS